MKRTLLNYLIPNLFINALLFSFNSLASPSALSLQEAENLALQHNLSIRAAQQGVQEAYHSSQESWSQLMPRVTAGRSYQEQRIESTNTLGEKKETHVKSSSNSISLSQEIPYIGFSTTKALDGNTQKLSELQLQQSRLEVVTQVRKSYYAAKMAEALLEQALQNLKLAQQDAFISQKRYKLGYINNVERQRTFVLKDQLEILVEERRTQLENAQKNLRHTLNPEDSISAEAPQLVTPFPEDFDFFSLAEDNLKKLSEPQNSYSLSLKEAEKKQMHLLTKQAQNAYWPKIQLGIHASESDPDRGTSFQNPQYTASVSWEIFDGLRDYHGEQKAHARYLQAETALQKERLDLSHSVDTTLKRLHLKKKSYLHQQKVIRSWKNILTQSRQRFESGNTSASQISNDTRDYLEQQERLLQIAYEMISLAADLSLATGDPKLFETLI